VRVVGWPQVSIVCLVAGCVARRVLCPCGLWFVEQQFWEQRHQQRQQRRCCGGARAAACHPCRAERKLVWVLLCGCQSCHHTSKPRCQAPGACRGAVCAVLCARVQGKGRVCERASAACAQLCVQASTHARACQCISVNAAACSGPTCCMAHPAVVHRFCWAAFCTALLAAQAAVAARFSLQEALALCCGRAKGAHVARVRALVATRPAAITWYHPCALCIPFAAGALCEGVRVHVSCECAPGFSSLRGFLCVECARMPRPRLRGGLDWSVPHTTVTLTGPTNDSSSVTKHS
jgi:hypothetical protein